MAHKIISRMLLVRRINSLVDFARENKSQGEVVLGALMAMQVNPALSPAAALKAALVANGIDDDPFWRS